MIQIKRLIKEIHDVESIYPKDVYNLYYLEFISSRYPEVIQTPYGKEILGYYLQNLKQKYAKLFKALLYKQIYKYVTRNRIDPDFDKDALQPAADAKTLKDLMAKTFRSDMKRRNDVWNAVAGYTYGLENASSPAQIFVNINGLNNAVHNTGGKIMYDPQKVSNYSELRRAFDAADAIKNQNQWELLKSRVDKDIRDLLNQEQPGELMEQDFDKESVAYKSGVQMALRDKLTDHDRKLNGLPHDFVAGYNSIRRTSVWDKLNSRLTQLAVMLGNGNR